MPYLGGGYRQRGATRDRVAALLMAASGPVTTGEVAAKCRVSRATVAAELAALERAGWAERLAGEGREPDRWRWREASGAVA